MMKSIKERFHYIWRVTSRPEKSEFTRLNELAQDSLLESMLFLLLGATVIMVGVTVLSGVEIEAIELTGFTIGLALGLFLWSSVAFLYTRLLGGGAPRLFRAFLFLTSSALLALLVLAVFVAYIPWIGSLLGVGLILYSQVLALLAFHHMAGVGWILSVLGTLATSVVSIGLFQLLGRMLFGWLAG